VNLDLQEDFSMDQGRCRCICWRRFRCGSASADYAWTLITLVESILENPELILRKQLDKVKDRKMAR